MSEEDVAGYSAKEWNSGTDEHRDAHYDEALIKPGLKKLLNSEATIDVDMPDATSSKLRLDFGWSPDIRSTTAPIGAGASGRELSTKTGFSPYRPLVKG